MNKWIKRIDERPKLFIYGAFLLFFIVNNGIDATSVWMEATRGGATPNFQLWEPFVWEYSSALSNLILLPIIFYWFAHAPQNLSQLPKIVFFHFVATIVYCSLHVSLMVGLRKLVYAITDSNYTFGNLLVESFYEYRKDALGYLFILFLYHVFRFIYSRVKGEANLIDTETEVENATTPEHFLVKKLDKEFLINISEIEWLEASGNYVNLHLKGRIYPMRATLSKTLPRLADKGFSQVHRSYAVNHHSIDSIEPNNGGDSTIRLKNGQSLPLSRRYKQDFKKKLI